MGNYRFRLSDLIPSSWFYKLKENNKTRKSQHKSSSSPSPVAVAVAEPKSHLSDHRKSYHFTRDLTLISSNSPLKPRISDRQYSPVEPPRRSSRRRRSTKRNRPPQRFVTSSVSANSSCRVSLESTFTKPPGESPSLRDLDQTSSSDYDSISPECGSVRGLTPDTFDGMLSCSTSCRCSIDNDTVSEHDHLPPIITKKLQEPTKIPIPSSDFSERSAYGSLSVKVMKEDFSSTASTTSSSRDHQNKRITSLVRRHSPKALSPGLRLRMNSPRIGNLRIQARKNTTMSSNPSSGSRRSVSDSFAVMKSSKDPQRDFRESMLEMIVENNIRVSKDLEELLACYLSLNSDEYHDLIINVFKQIWFEFLHVRLK